MALFFISWAPFHVQRLAYHYHHYFNIQWFIIQTLLAKSARICSAFIFNLICRYRTFNQYLMYVSGCFYFLSSTLNPILYNLMSCKYRKAFRAVLLCAPQQSPKVNYQIYLTRLLLVVLQTIFVMSTSRIQLQMKNFFEREALRGEEERATFTSKI